MPFYEYECQSCKFYSEVMQKITDAPLRKCPSCGKNTMKKLISAPNFRLKGGGWYETDFKSDKEAKRNLAEGDGAQKEAKPAEAAEKTESKPAEAKPGESKPAQETTGASRSVSISRTPSRGASASREGAGARRGASAAKAAASHRATRRPGSKPASRATKARPARSKSRR